MIIVVSLSFLQKPIRLIYADIQAQKTSLFYLNVLKNRYKVTNVRMASDKNWGQMVVFAYHLNSKYFGIPKNHRSRNILLKELVSNDVDYYFAFDRGTKFKSENFVKLTKDDNLAFDIYKIIQ